MKPRFFNLFTLFALLTSLLGSALTYTPAYAATNFAVNTTNDTTDVSAGDGICADVSVACSLRAAIEEANALAGADTITVPAGTYTLTLGSQLPVVTTDITIKGNGAANTIIQANAAAKTATYRIFEVDGTGTLTLDSLTVRHGQCNGACDVFSTYGGGIFNNGTLTITNSTLSNNSAASGGGGVFNSGTMALTDVTFSGNSATNGGGMYDNGTARLTNVTFNTNSATDGGGMYDNGGTTLMNVTFSGNSATNSGGGMYTISSPALTNVTFSGNSATSGGGMYASGGNGVTLTNVTFSGNSATSGGGMYANGGIKLMNVTFSGNSATGQGGGMFNNSSSTLTNVTFSGNFATDGGGMYNTSTSSGLTNVTFSGNSATSNGGGMYNSGISTLTNVTFSGNSATNGGGVYNNGNSTLKNVIIANSTSGGDCFNNIGTLNAQNSLIEGGLTCVNGTNTNNLTGDPVLGALTNNGGSTQTFALLAGSPAIDTGTNTGCPATDQRGVTRPVDGDAVIGALCDIGAYEYVPSVPPTATFGDVPIDYWAWQYIESIYKAGITGGCSTSPMEYCPTDTVTRAQMAIFLLRGIHGKSYTPAVATGAVFGDVPADHWAAKWIEQLSAEGITSGCGNGNYCPDAVISRAEMSIFLLRAKYGKDYVPPTATGAIFADVPADYWAGGWIEQLLHDGISTGCGNNSFCPDGNVTRDQMAVFLQKTFNLPLP